MASRKRIAKQFEFASRIVNIIKSETLKLDDKNKSKQRQYTNLHYYYYFFLKKGNYLAKNFGSKSLRVRLY